MRSIRFVLALVVVTALVPAAAHASWLVEIVDQNHPSSGIGSSLAIDAQGNPHIAYLDANPAVNNQGLVRYAHRSAAGWHPYEDLDSGPVDLQYGLPELVLDAAGTPHVAYALSIVPGIGIVLKFASRNGAGTWSREVVAQGNVFARSFVAMDALGRPHVLYLDSNTGSARLIHATRTAPGAWSRQVVSTDPSAMPAGIRLDASGRTLVLFKTGFPTVVRLATTQGASVTSEVIDASQNLVAVDFGFVVDAAGTPYVSYRDYNSGGGRLATRSGATWSVEATPVDAGFSGSAGGLAVGGDGTVFVGFATGGVSYPYATRLRVSRRVAGSWTTENVQSVQAPIGGPALALDPQGHPRLTYWLSTEPFIRTELRYARYSPGSTGVIRRVPADYATIQAAITAAADEDTVLVSPGTYDENLHFIGKAILVVSTDGAAATIVDGGDRDAVVTFEAGEDARSIIDGFTLRNGRGSFDAGGVFIAGADPVVRNNVIEGNEGATGAGISVNPGSPLIENNLIRLNHARSWGGAVSIGGFSSARLLRNRIEGNDASYEGGAIYLNGAGTPEIRGNVIVDNRATQRGGAILSYNHSDALVADNVIARNQAGNDGGGLFWLTPSGSRGPFVINNTFVDNVAARGSAIFVDGYDGAALIANNLVAGAGGAGLLYSGSFNDGNNPSTHHNDVFPSSGSAWGGLFGNLTGTANNVSVDPSFVDRAGGDYRVAAGSVAIDRGDGAAPGLGSVDVAGAPRVIDGDGNGSAIVDLGAFEFVLGVPPPVAEAGPDQTVECAPVAEGGTAVVLDGRKSTGTGLTFHWTAPGVRFEDASAAMTTAWFPTAVTTVVLEVSDGSRTDSDEAVISIVDTTPPVLEVALDPALLWPPNGRLVPIHATVTAADACATEVFVTLVSIVSTDPGAGDIEGAAPGTADFDFALRAEREGDGPGRYYAVTYEARDASGNVARATTPAFVPHDKGGRAALASGTDPAILTVFGADDLEVRSILPASLEGADPDHVRFRALPEGFTFADLDGDGREDLRVLLHAVPEPAPPSQFGLYARWVAGGRHWSAPVSVPVGVTPVGPATAFAATVVPNPARAGAVLRLAVPAAGRVEITLYDVRGREIDRSARHVSEAGTHDIALGPLNRLAAGLCFYRVRWEGRTTAGRFVVTR